MRRWQWRVWLRLCPTWRCSLERRTLIPVPWSVTGLISLLRYYSNFKPMFFSEAYLIVSSNKPNLHYSVCSVRLCCPLQSRPFGVALLFGGVDEKGPQLYVKITICASEGCSPLILTSQRPDCYLFMNEGTTWTHQEPLCSVMLGPSAQRLREHRALCKRFTTRYQPLHILNRNISLANFVVFKLLSCVI